MPGSGSATAMAGFLNAVARLGAAGGTARWAARVYHRWVRLAPEDPVQLDAVLTTLIATRYDVDALVRPAGNSQRISTALGILQNAGRVRGVCHLVVLMLTAEGHYVDTGDDVKMAHVEVIAAELTANGVPARLAYGEDLSLCPRHLCAAYLPSTRLLKLLLAA